MGEMIYKYEKLRLTLDCGYLISENNFSLHQGLALLEGYKEVVIPLIMDESPFQPVRRKRSLGFCSKMDKGRTSNLDVISNLPRDAIDTILMHLPIRDAVRTSILSTKWRYKWVNVPKIKFDSQCYPSSISSFDPKVVLLNLKRTKIVDQVLLQHRGPIQKFECSDYLHPCSDFDHWILFLSRRGINEVIIKFSGDHVTYKLPSCLFSCQKLYHLRLECCIFNIPTKFKSFSCLKSLYLREVCFFDNELECLISNSPLLEKLTFVCNYGSNRLKINAPNLRFLYLDASFEVLCFEYTPVLAYWKENFTECLRPRDICSLTNVLPRLLFVDKLGMQHHFLQILALGDIPDKVPNTFLYLKNLSLHVRFGNRKEIMVVLCLFRSAPLLEELEVNMNSFIPRAENSDWEAQEVMDCMFYKLRTVKVTMTSGAKLEFEFIKLLLMNSPVLETLTIVESRLSFYVKARISEELMGFQRASTQARIIYSR
ncbi:F-box/FBD/LRR-repeat protein At1g13570-like [Tasmannia lanceolata]|uniref:F-box/FBD/LRR-repeat protein At1g13570-like n=1 Tax=Tasmannia lanceolata TaxID=3420 RepID=UPI004062D054